MKFKTFRALVITGATVVGVGACFVCGKQLEDDPEPPPDLEARPLDPIYRAQVQPPEVPVAPVEPASAPSPREGGGEALRALDHQLLERARQPISGDKVKDAFKSQSWKANLYSDSGGGQVDRLKLDLDRDDKWDEKWTFEREGGDLKVKRQVAPADDERYTAELRLQAGAWVEK